MNDGTISRRRQFAQAPDALITDKRVNDFAVRLWCRLDHYAGTDGRAFPHVDKLAADLGVSASKIDRAVRRLVETGWITRRRRGFSNIIDTVLNDEPVDGARQTSRSDASVQVTEETSDLTLLETSDLALPETSDLTFPKKETHSKETQENKNPSSPAHADDHEDPPRPDVEELCARLRDGLIANGIARPPKIGKAWRDEARRLLDRDGITLDRARYVLQWAINDPFWSTNVQSMPTFRKQFDRLDARARQEWEAQQRATRPEQRMTRGDQAVARGLTEAALMREAESLGMTDLADIYRYVDQRLAEKATPGHGAGQLAIGGPL